MEAYSDHSDIPELYQNQVKPGKPMVMIGYIGNIINDCISNKEICGKKERYGQLHFQSMGAYSDHSKIPELYQHQ
eukprot:12798286-Heterocapsa_arctica.AAC.1